MINKNKSVSVEGKTYEITFLTANADHIAREYYREDDPGDHLSFSEIEQVISDAVVVRRRSANRCVFSARIENRKYMALTYLIGRRCVVKSGRICNFDDVLNAPEWRSK